jgi:hypothetical protein
VGIRAAFIRGDGPGPAFELSGVPSILRFSADCLVYAALT